MFAAIILVVFIGMRLRPQTFPRPGAPSDNGILGKLAELGLTEGENEAAIRAQAAEIDPRVDGMIERLSKNMAGR